MGDDDAVLQITKFDKSGTVAFNVFAQETNCIEGISGLLDVRSLKTG